MLRNQEFPPEPLRMGLREDPGRTAGRLHRLGDRVELQEILTYDQTETLCLVALGLSGEQIAERLSKDPKSVRQRLTGIYQAFGIEPGMGNKRVMVARWWWQVGVHAAPLHLRRWCGEGP